MENRKIEELERQLTHTKNVLLNLKKIFDSLIGGTFGGGAKIKKTLEYQEIERSLKEIG